MSNFKKKQRRNSAKKGKVTALRFGIAVAFMTYSKEL